VQFLNPALVAGALLFAVPLIIHLLNRQRHQRRPWAAMEFLLRAYQKQRNRLRRENLLLLLLRCLVPILLALAIARPVLRQAASLLGGSGIVHHVVVVDGSYSMGLRQDGATSSFERARALVGQLLDRFEANTNRSDKVTLVLAGVRPRFLARGDLDLATVRGQWLQLQKPEDGAAEIAEALRQVATTIEEAPDPEVRVYVFSDLQARSLGKLLAPGDKAAPELQDTARDVVERLAKHPGTEVHWIDVGPFAATHLGGVADNLQITDLRMQQPVAVLRTAVDFVATLKNRGQTAANCQVTLEVDGGEPMRKVVAVPPGGEGEADFQVVFRESGRRRLRASMPNDALAADDERFLTVDVRDRVRVLLVDGDAGGDPLLASSSVWQMLDPDPSALPMFAVESVDIVSLLGGQCTPKNHDVIVLADVERLNERATQSLVEALQAGRGLFVMYGEHADAQSYNLHLHGAGDGPQPFRLTQKLGGVLGSGSSRSATITAPEHPLLREFGEETWRDVFEHVPISRWHEIAPDSLNADATVVARITDAARTPLLVARPFGDGKAVFLTSAVTSKYKPERWNLLNEPIVAYPLLVGIVQWLALPAVDPFLAEVGGELSCSLPSRPENVEVMRPERDGRPKAPLAEEPASLPGNRFRLGPLADTPFAGFYTFDFALERAAGKEAVSLPFAVNVAPDEGDLRFASHEEARAALGLERVLDGLPRVAAAAEDPERSELGPTLLLLTLLFVLGEAALARHVSARRN
jgi:hypothetical protein